MLTHLTSKSISRILFLKNRSMVQRRFMHKAVPCSAAQGRTQRQQRLLMSQAWPDTQGSFTQWAVCYHEKEWTFCVVNFGKQRNKISFWQPTRSWLHHLQNAGIIQILVHGHKSYIFNDVITEMCKCAPFG